MAFANNIKSSIENASISAARNSIQEIRRITQETLAEFESNSESKMWRLSYLKRQFEYKDLDQLFRKYTEKINQAYFYIFLMLEVIISNIHFITVVAVNLEENKWTVVMLDLIFYLVISILSCAILYTSDKFFASRRTIFIISMIYLLLMFLSNFTIPIVHHIMETANNLRPAYTTHAIIACYVFFNIERDQLALMLGVLISLCDLLILGLITYRNCTMLWHRLGSDIIYLLCVNSLGLYYRFTNELVKRRTFLDRRACVESTLKLKYEKEQEEQLLLSIIPKFTMNQVREDFLTKIEHIRKMNTLPSTEPLDIPFVNEYRNVTILYADIVNYTVMTSSLPAIKMVEILNELFGAFDDASEELKVLRIKFLGDCYYCVAGLPPHEDCRHAEACIDLGLRMISIIQKVREKNKLLIDMRIGIHTGTILSGIIGSTKWQFDIWSKDVQLANRMETTGEPGKVHVTDKTWSLVEKPYNVIPTNKGQTEPLLMPFNISTFLIYEPYSENTPNGTRTSNGQRVKKLSMIGENAPKTTSSRIFLLEISDNAQSEDETITEEVENGVVTHRYERRTSWRNSDDSGRNSIDRRWSGNSSVSKKINERRITPGDAKRRTAFMNNNIKKYRERIKQTNSMMEEAIESMPLSKFDRKYQVKDISLPLLIFKDLKLEFEYNMLPDPLIVYYIVTYIGILICITLIQHLTLTQWNWMPTISYTSIALSALIFFPLIWMHYIWDRFYGNFRNSDNIKPKIRILYYWYNLSHFTTKSLLFRIMFYVFACGLMTACIIMEYHLTQSLLLLIVANFLFLRIHVWLKLLFACGVSTFYTICVWNFGNNFYEDSETYNYMMPSKLAHILSLVFLTFTLHLIDRQADYMNKLDFQWNKRLRAEQNESNYMCSINKLLLRNILPKHVAEIYLDINRNPQELYHEEYSDVAVMFATVLDYYESDDETLNISAMNRIVRDFDYFLFNEKRIEKIKVTNWTYMVACGLEPGRRTSINDENPKEHVAVTLLKFATNLMQSLDQFNRDSSQQCRLRIGIANGEVMAGVVGSRKPLYDIWGDTVNVASRMDSTGISGRIQVTDRTATIIQSHRIMCEFRGLIHVKGKGNQIPTYFVILNENNELTFS